MYLIAVGRFIVGLRFDGLFYVGIILRMDPSLSKFMKDLKKQAEDRKVSSATGIVPKPAAIEVVSPEIAVAPPVNKKRGRPSKVQKLEVGTSSGGKPVSMLGLGLRVAPTMQFDLLPEDEGILAAVPTLHLIEEMVELQCRAAVVSRAIGDELKRAESVVILRLKAKLDESSQALKKALQDVDACQKEKEREAQMIKEEQETLKAMVTKLTAERDELVQEKADLTTEKESLNVEIEKYQGFMLRINEESFNQGLRQATFFHGIPADDSRYDLGKDVVNGRLVPLGEDVDDAGQVMEEPSTDIAKPDETIDII